MSLSMALLLTLLMPAMWMLSFMLVNVIFPVRVMRLEERKGRKTIPTGCGVQQWAPDVEAIETRNFVTID